jgi:hypothetical protein
MQPIREFLSAFLHAEDREPDYKKIIQDPSKAKWLDPCAGGDTKHPMSYYQVIADSFEPAVLDTMDIREDSLAETKADYLATPMLGYDIIITNPPFYLAKEIIEKALSEVNDGGYVIMLLRLNFLGSKGRYEFWDKYPAKHIFVHHQRMSFTDKGGTDSIEYAHFVWQKGHKPETMKLEII